MNPDIIDVVVRRLPPSDVALLLAARGLPSVVHRGPAAAADALADALIDELDYEWERDECDHTAEDPPYHTATMATMNGALVACGQLVIAFGGMDLTRREVTKLAVWDLSPGAEGGFHRVQCGGGPPLHPAGMFGVAHDGELWIFPGPGAAVDDAARVSVFDPSAARWRHLQTAGPSPAADAHTMAPRTVVGVVDDTGSRARMWAVGGERGGGVKVFSFDFRDLAWTRHALASPTPHFTLGCAVFHKGRVWVHGSTAPDEHDAPSAVFSFDAAARDRAWRPARPPRGARPAPTFRLHAASAVVGDRWILHGGRYPGPFNVVAAAFEFSFATEEWAPVLALGTATRAREWHAGVGLADCAVFVGGRTDIQTSEEDRRYGERAALDGAAFDGQAHKDDLMAHTVELLWVRGPRAPTRPTGPAALLASLASLDRAAADVTLIASDATRVPAVRAALTAHSPVFATMLLTDGRWPEGRPGGEVSVADVDGATLKALVAYCHAALPALPTSLPALLALFEAADKYDVAGLVAETVAGARARARPADVAALLAAAERRACAPLTAVCEEVAAGGLAAVLAAPSFEALCRAEPDVGLAFVRRVVERLGMPGSDDGGGGGDAAAGPSLPEPESEDDSEDDAPAGAPGTPAQAVRAGAAGAADPPTPGGAVVNEE